VDRRLSFLEPCDVALQRLATDESPSTDLHTPDLGSLSTNAGGCATEGLGASSDRTYTGELSRPCRSVTS
jgi:hypothetical protein